MNHRFLLSGMIATLLVGSVGRGESPNINALTPEIVVPKVATQEAGAGLRVQATTTGWNGMEVHHLLYLPDNWTANQKMPVLVEFPGNGGFRNDLGDVSDGTVDGCQLGYGLSRGKDFVWICLPFISVNADGTKSHCTTWWGDVAETKRYCISTVREVCERYGGDPARVILCGFSRGAIACNYIGLHDDDIAGLWRAFVCHSHYDGVRTWSYQDSDSVSALERLRRLSGRAQWISHEVSVGPTREYIQKAGVQAEFTFVAIPYANHSAAWVLRDIPETLQARQWLSQIIK